MTRRSYIADIKAHFTGPFLSALCNADQAVISVLDDRRCQLTRVGSGISIEFQLSNLFDALWIHASQSGVALPEDSDWDRDFNEFCAQLMFPWPSEELQNAGFAIQVMYKSNSTAKCKYRLYTEESIPRRVPPIG